MKTKQKAMEQEKEGLMPLLRKCNTSEEIVFIIHDREIHTVLKLDKGANIVNMERIPLPLPGQSSMRMPPPRGHHRCLVCLV